MVWSDDIAEFGVGWQGLGGVARGETTSYLFASPSNLICTKLTVVGSSTLKEVAQATPRSTPALDMYRVNCLNAAALNAPTLISTGVPSGRDTSGWDGPPKTTPPKYSETHV